MQLIYRTLTSTGSSLEDDELVLHAAADQLCGGVDRRLVLVHLGEFRGPDQRLSVADQFGTTGFTLLAGSSNQSSRRDRACSSHCRQASDDRGAVTMSALPHKTNIVS